ncbi:heavy metal-associated isoprenylated plant protein 3-like isoform X1 [Punica granatum]|uniref:Heavy metal-associated isoprenylated plant protein 3-like isoform X1 n=2 Tax=Punica granatum TaxID=22663 RepID=A0A6P8E3U8_PUNGR|nr:heavy metal-associated isoprenylated plant protein 3-like isoform X1 [Punica granatum]
MVMAGPLYKCGPFPAFLLSGDDYESLRIGLPVDSQLTMGEKKAKKDEGEKAKSDDSNGITVVLKTEMHCEGCATKILKCVRTIEGVEKAKAEWESNKLTVKGDVDPAELREELQERLNKKVELVSPSQLPKKDKDGGNGNSGKKSDSNKDNKKKDDNKSGSKDNKKKADEKKAKEKEAPVTTAVLKLRLHCEGCIVKIGKTALKTKGVASIAIDKAKELVTVTGTMDVKALAESLEEKMKRSVQIVSPKKDKDGGGGGEGNNNGGGGGGGGGKKNKKQDGGGDDGDDHAENDGGMFHVNGMEYVGPLMPSYGPVAYGPGYMYGAAAGSGPGYGYPYPNPFAYGNNLHAPQMFSDENPNACSVM